jgi:uncharacterized protein YdaL
MHPRKKETMDPKAGSSIFKGGYRALAPVLAFALVGSALGGCSQRTRAGSGGRPSHESGPSLLHNAAPGEGTPGVALAGSVDSMSSEVVSLQSALTGIGVPATGPNTLVLYDSTGPYGVLGQLYAIGATNLASHFGSWNAKTAASYVCGEAATYTAVVYLGSTYDEPLQTCLLDDIMASTKPVIWAGFNIWRLMDRVTYNVFVGKFGFTWSGLDATAVAEVTYKNRALTRYAANGAGILVTSVLDPVKAQILATAKRANGTTFPWAMRSGTFTYVGEIPFSYLSEEDRVLAFSDLLFDALAPTTVERHRALLRLEDLSATSDMKQLRAVADYLFAQKVPFGFGVIPDYHDPGGVYNNGVTELLPLAGEPEFVATIKYLTSKGGTLILHGPTHQWDGAINPYTRVSADDTEYYRTVENADHTVTYVGPLPQDSTTWATNKLTAADNMFRAAAIPLPTIFEFPHYAASATAYRAVAKRYTTRWDRTVYFPGLLTGLAPDHSRPFGQLFPYVVRDVYGTKVLPENLGNIEPEPFYGYPARSPAMIIAAAARNLVVRDGFAAFYFHPFFPITLLQQTVTGIKGLGYTFVSPTSL